MEEMQINIDLEKMAFRKQRKLNSVEAEGSYEDGIFEFEFN